MMITRYHLILLLALSATTENVHAFTIPSRPFGTLRVKTAVPKSTLRAGFATEGYLDSLTELARTSSAYSTEEYLNSLARLGDNAYRTSSPSYEQTSFGYGSSFNVADTSSFTEEAANAATMNSHAVVTTNADAANGWFDASAATPATQVAYDPLMTSDFAASAREASEIAANAKASVDEVATRLTDFSTSGVAAPVQELFDANSGNVGAAAEAAVKNDAASVPSSPMNAMASTNLAEYSAGEAAEQSVAASVASVPVDAVATTDQMGQAAVQVGNPMDAMIAATPMEQTAVQATATSSTIEQAVAQVGSAVSDVAATVGNSFNPPLTTDPLGFSRESAVEKATEIAASASASMNEVGMKLSEGISSANAGSSPQINELIGQVAGASNTLVVKSTEPLAAAEQLLTNMEDSVHGRTTAALDTAELALTNMENNVADHVIAALDTTELQLTNMENSVVGTIDQLLRSVSGTHYEDVVRVLESAKASIVGLISGAVQSITDTIGQLTFAKIAHFGESVYAGLQDGYAVVEEVVKSLVALDIAIVKLLFQVISFVVKAVSGKNIPEWTMAADGIVNQEAGKLSAQASATAADLSDKSLRELVAMMGTFLQQMATLMTESVGAVFGAVESATAPFAGSMASSSMDSVSETVSSVMTNL